jgi:hypothetical protein
MTRTVGLLLLLAPLACQTSERFPPGGGNPGGGVDTQPGFDASPPDAPEGEEGAIRGQLCRVVDLAARTACLPVGGTGLTVRVLPDGEPVAVAADGTFAVPGVPGELQVRLATNTDDELWVGGAADVDLDPEGGATGVGLRVMLRADLDDVLAASLAGVAPGDGILVVHVDEEGVPAAGAVLLPEPRYDTGDPGVFAFGAGTGPHGTAVYFGIAPVEQSISVQLGGGAAQLYTVTPAADAITFARAEL